MSVLAWLKCRSVWLAGGWNQALIRPQPAGAAASNISRKNRFPNVLHMRFLLFHFVIDARCPIRDEGGLGAEYP